MRKWLITFGAAVLLAAPAFATYWVVLKDGSKYAAKAKWTVLNGKALVALNNGSTISLDPNAIDVAKSEEMTRMGGGAVLAIEATAAKPTQPQPSSLGSSLRLRKLPGQQPTTSTAPPPIPPTKGPLLGTDVLSKFERAYENVGIFEHTLTPTGAHSLRAELTADNEEKVFNALSATSFLIVRIPGSQVDMVELFMKTTTGGVAGRFQMSRLDAQALDAKQISREDYFIRKVIY